MFTVSSADYVIRFQIGKSNFSSGVIYAGKYNKTNEAVAIKKYDIDSISLDKIDSLRKELYLMNQLKHPNIITAFTAFVAGLDILVISPLMEYKSCADLISNHFLTGLPEIVIRVILRSILVALQFIHEKGVIHRSVKASHVLIGLDGHVKLSGLQYAIQRKRNCSSNSWPRSFSFPKNSLANLNWLSPEVLRQNCTGYDEKSDIFSLGITVCELANGFVPYSNINLSTMLMKKVTGDIPLIYDSTTVNITKDTSDEEFVKIFNNYFTNKRFSKNLHKFKNLCFIYNPLDRPGAKSLLLHNIITKIDKKILPFHRLIVPAVPITSKCFTSSDFGNLCYCGDDVRESSIDKNQLNGAVNVEPCEWDF